jgi:hypothetical protein
VTSFTPTSTSKPASVVTAGAGQAHGGVGMRYLGLGVAGVVLIL